MCIFVSFNTSCLHLNTYGTQSVMSHDIPIYRDFEHLSASKLLPYSDMIDTIMNLICYFVFLDAEELI